MRSAPSFFRREAGLFQHKITYFLMGVGILGFLFSFVRTLWLVRRQARERKAVLERAREMARRMNDPAGGGED
jgi:hypothetical protein